MGGKSSKTIARIATKPIKNYNIENRVQKVIENHTVNPKVAPYYPSESEKIERFIEATPEIKEELERKDPVVIERMRQLQLDSSGTNPVLKPKELPQRRYLQDPFILMENPETVPKGQISLHNLAIILERFKIDPNIDTVKKVANDYSLDLQTAGRILKFYEPVNIEDQNLTPESRKKMKKNMKLLEKHLKRDDHLRENNANVNSGNNENR